MEITILNILGRSPQELWESKAERERNIRWTTENCIDNMLVVDVFASFEAAIRFVQDNSVSLFYIAREDVTGTYPVFTWPPEDAFREAA